MKKGEEIYAVPFPRLFMEAAKGEGGGEEFLFSGIVEGHSRFLCGHFPKKNMAVRFCNL